ncbi:hypothetical protein V8C34DRAFT_289495 [Trichoderma compactum]
MSSLEVSKNLRRCTTENGADNVRFPCYISARTLLIACSPNTRTRRLYSSVTLNSLVPWWLRPLVISPSEPTFELTETCMIGLEELCTLTNKPRTIHPSRYKTIPTNPLPVYSKLVSHPLAKPDLDAVADHEQYMYASWNLMVGIGTIPSTMSNPIAKEAVNNPNDNVPRGPNCCATREVSSLKPTPTTPALLIEDTHAREQQS